MNIALIIIHPKKAYLFDIFHLIDDYYIILI